MKAKAVVFTDRLKVAVQAVDLPEPKNDEVVIDVAYSWISIGTESSFFRGDRIGGERLRKESDPLPFPHVPGYQKVGTIRSVGAAVTGLAVGDRVFASISWVSNMFFKAAGHVSPAVTPANQVWKLPIEADPIDYAGLVLTQVGYNCGSRPTVHSGDLAIVIGDGLVGQWTAQTLRHSGARVIVLGRHNERLQFLPRGIERINTKETPLQEALQQNNGISIVVDTVGDMQTVRNIQPFMKRNSHLVSAGFLADTGLVDIQSFREQEITLHAPSGWTKDRMDQTLDGIRQGWLQVSNLITHRYPVDQAEEAWNTILKKEQPCLGVILEW